jgi:hypothetical protein
MRTGNLPSPAKCYLNLAVTTISAVAYKKIVADSFPVVYFPMHLVKYSCVSFVCRRMMYGFGVTGFGGTGLGSERGLYTISGIGSLSKPQPPKTSKKLQKTRALLIIL